MNRPHLLTLFLQLFRLDVFYEAPDGTLAVAPGSHIQKELHSILEMAMEKNRYPVGVLTNEHRDTWYQCRERLVKGKACLRGILM